MNPPEVNESDVETGSIPRVTCILNGSMIEVYCDVYDDRIMCKLYRKCNEAGNVKRNCYPTNKFFNNDQ